MVRAAWFMQYYRPLMNVDSYMWSSCTTNCIKCVNNSKERFHSDCRYLLDIKQEQQLYYKEITEACVGSCESKRAVSSFLPFWSLA